MFFICLVLAGIISIYNSYATDDKKSRTNLYCSTAQRNRNISIGCSDEEFIFLIGVEDENESCEVNGTSNEGGSFNSFGKRAIKISCSYRQSCSLPHLEERFRHTIENLNRKTNIYYSCERCKTVQHDIPGWIECDANSGINITRAWIDELSCPKTLGIGMDVTSNISSSCNSKRICQIPFSTLNPTKLLNILFSCTGSPTQENSTVNDKLTETLIGSLAGVVVVIIVGILILFCLRRERYKKSSISADKAKISTHMPKTNSNTDDDRYESINKQQEDTTHYETLAVDDMSTTYSNQESD